MANIDSLKSHPDKYLLDHVKSVRENVRKITEGLRVSQFAELAAIFHDLGKINPHFQKKLHSKPTTGYSNHAYLSAYAFFCAFACIRENFQELKKKLQKEKLTTNELVAVAVIIAKHHGHLPDFCPNQSNLEKESYILSREEIDNLFSFLKKELDVLPIKEYTEQFKEWGIVREFEEVMKKDNASRFLNKLSFDSKYTKGYLDFFLEVQFAFSALILADKCDTAHSTILDDNKKAIRKFCKIYPAALTKYISRFKADSELNILRERIRKESVERILEFLKTGKRVFELTASTGAGKTIILLLLACEIIKAKGDFRILYALPYLSINEQVEAEVLEICKDFSHEKFVQRIDSKSNNQNFNRVQELLEADPSPENFKELSYLMFQEQIFAYPFVITTFVRFFETLLSNRNDTLLKLPNFSNTIFLIDEIQSLPPRLYTFFVAYLTKFCEKFNCYAILSTATQPNFELPKNKDVTEIFDNYEKPVRLLEHKKYFESDIFNRYQILYKKDPINIKELSELVLSENDSVLIILNTIDDSKELFDILSSRFQPDELYLLNTHFTPNDRKKKIRIIKERLKQKKKTILVSTQLIEAGVDLDFPIVYRDFASISSIIQSAGRCNRNGKLLGFGKVVLFNLVKGGKSRANLIYGRGRDKDILMFTKEALGFQEVFQERELHKIQEIFFDKIANQLQFGKHSQKKSNLIDLDLSDCIKKCAYATLGKVQLIDEKEFGEQYSFYIPANEDDDNFERLLALQREIKCISRSRENEWDLIKVKNYMFQTLFKEMSNQIVAVRLGKANIKPILAHSENVNGVYKANRDSYSFEKGMMLYGENCIL